MTITAAIAATTAATITAATAATTAATNTPAAHQARAMATESSGQLFVWKGILQALPIPRRYSTVTGPLLYRYGPVTLP